MNQNIWDITNDDFIKFVNESTTYSDLLIKCGYTNLGNRNTVKKRIQLLKLSTNHFVKYKIPNKQKTPLEEIFIENSTYNNNANIKKILFKEYKWEYKCLECKIIEYNNKPIQLELDHINGNNKDNRLENLRLLCPNCHSQTPTFRVKNIIKVEESTCNNCDNKIKTKNISGYCKICIPKFRENRRKVERPTLEQLENDFKELKTYEAVGRKYTVSGNCIRKL